MAVKTANVVNVAEAEAKLSKLLEATLRGEEVIVAKRGLPLVRLVPVAPKKRGLGFSDNGDTRRLLRPSTGRRARCLVRGG